MKIFGKLNTTMNICIGLFFVDEYFGNIKKIKFLNKHSNKKLENINEKDFNEICSISEYILYKLIDKKVLP